MTDTCEACGNRLRKDGEVLSAYRCPSCGMTYIDGVRYVPYEERRCDTCDLGKPHHWLGTICINDTCHPCGVEPDHFCKNWRRKG